MDDDQIITALPAKARKKFEELARVANAARAAARAASDIAADARDDRDRSLFSWRQSVADNRRLDISEEPSHLVAFREKAKKLSAAAVEESERAKEITQPYSYVRAWLDHVIKAGSRIVYVERPALKSSGDFLADVKTARAQIIALDQEIAATEAAPAPPDAIRERAIAALDGLAEAGQLQISPYSRGEDPAGLKTALRFNVFSGPDGVGRISNGSAGLLAWALRDVLAEKIGKLVDACQTEGALSDDERDKRLAKLSGQKLEAERREEALIEAAAAARLTIPRRPDADPRAILGVTDQ